MIHIYVGEKSSQRPERLEIRVLTVRAVNSKKLPDVKRKLKIFPSVVRIRCRQEKGHFRAFNTKNAFAQMCLKALL